MAKHLELLRAYYRERRRRQRAAARVQPLGWTEDMVVGWAALWRIPPFDSVYPVLQRGSLCPCTSGAAHNRLRGVSFVEATFPEGILHCCGDCGVRWLVLE